MTSKISAALAAALILGSASVALAANSKPQTVRQQPRQPSVMLLEEGAQVRGPAVNGYAVEENYRQAECVEVTPRVERTNDKGRGDPGPCSFPSAAVPRPNNIDERASAKIVRLYKIVCSLLRQF